MSDRKRVLWLVSWYPNKYDPFDGDFIQRHARAAALYNDIHVLFIKAFEEQVEREEEKKKHGSLTEQIIYLPKDKGVAGKLKSILSWQKTYKSEVASIIQQFAPHLIHVHVPWKVGLIAIWAKRKYKLPLVITEHWGIYNDIVEDNIHTKSFLFRYLLKLIYKEADAFVSVSTYVGKGVNQTVVKKAFTVIPNVVDTSLFVPPEKRRERFTFLHVSNMVPLKNADGIIRAFHRFLSNTGIDAQLVMIGNKDETYEKLAAELNLLNKSVFFKGEIPYVEVAKEMQSAHVLVLNSNIENSPCVIGEALCSGMPVIATRVGGIPELVHDSSGLLIPPNAEDELEKAFLQAFEAYDTLQNNPSYTAARDKFSPQTIGKQIDEVYSKVLRNKG